MTEDDYDTQIQLDDTEFFLITHIDGSDDNKLSGVIGFGVP